MTTCGGGGGDDCHGCCDDKKPAATNEPNPTLCLAVIRENGATVVLFDAVGMPRSFTYKGDAGKLCFSTHGNGQVDDLLTPCFDEDGLHGVPDESCFCGVDTPHLHAHLHDPKTCKDDESKQKNAQGESDLQYLAQLTLHPNDDFSADEAERLVNMAVSAQLPKQCNSQEFTRRMTERGLSRQSLVRRRMHKIQHDDHVDYLVHDQTTGDLTLEHPCDNCGDNDVHGQFHLVGKRRLQGGGAQLHFFEVAPNPFHILDHLSSLFDPNTDRVIAARPGRDDGHGLAHVGHDNEERAKKKKPCCESGVCTAATALLDDFADFDSVDGKTVRSTFLCTDICCASEIPMINEVLEPIPGVERVLINVPVKTVIVDHDPTVATAKDVEDVLNKNHFAAKIKHDGAARHAVGSSTEGRSQFFVNKICCASEIPAINEIVGPLPGVSKVSINVTTKMVYVDHDTAAISASEIADALNADRFGASVRHDAAKDVRAQVSAFVRSTLSFESPDKSSPDIETLKEFLGTFDPSQMEAFVVDVPAKKILVVHNPNVLPVETIVEKLAYDAGIEATVVVNGAESADWDFPEFEEELERLDEVATRPSTPTILSGIFWIISMLSLIGGNWYVWLVSCLLLTISC